MSVYVSVRNEHWYSLHQRHVWVHSSHLSLIASLSSLPSLPFLAYLYHALLSLIFSHPSPFLASLSIIRRTVQHAPGQPNPRCPHRHY